jgi:hypothetical protein
VNNAKLHTAMVRRSEAWTIVFEGEAIVRPKINWKLQKQARFFDCLVRSSITTKRASIVPIVQSMAPFSIESKPTS